LPLLSHRSYDHFYRFTGKIRRCNNLDNRCRRCFAFLLEPSGVVQNLDIIQMNGFSPFMDNPHKMITGRELRAF
jgi:hypothetical protein